MMKEIFPDRNYSGPQLRSQVVFEVPPVTSVNNGQETLRFLGPKISEMTPKSIMNSASFSIFKPKLSRGSQINVLADCEHSLSNSS